MFDSRRAPPPKLPLTLPAANAWPFIYKGVASMARLTFFGAAGEVTGSCYLLESARSRVLVDFGLFQGDRSSRARNEELPPIDAGELSAVVLTHAHLDHCGRLPLLIRAGYSGPIFATPATIELTGIILRDSAALQEADAEKQSRHRLREGRQPVRPLYTVKEAADVLRLFSPVEYDTPREIAPGIAVRFVDAGHILGSASIEMLVRDQPDSKVRTVVFSGDIGVPGSPILRDPVPFAQADVLVLESTYGDRDHRPLSQTLDELMLILDAARASDGKVLVPAFSIGRTQDIVYHLGQAARAGRTKDLSIYVDSPMAIAASELYERYPGLYDEETKALRRAGEEPLDFPGLRFSNTPQQSQRLNGLRDGTIIIAGSGMCTGGRILHHLRHGLWTPTNHVVFVGYQALGTLGRELVDGAKHVKIFGESIAVKAAVHTLGGFSAHAGQSDLVKWTAPVARSGPHVYLTHGEDGPRAALAGILNNQLGLICELPVFGQSVEV